MLFRKRTMEKQVGGGEKSVLGPRQKREQCGHYWEEEGVFR